MKIKQNTHHCMLAACVGNRKQQKKKFHVVQTNLIFGFLSIALLPNCSSFFFLDASSDQLLCSYW